MTIEERIAEQRTIAELRTRDDRARHDGDAHALDLMSRLA